MVLLENEQFLAELTKMFNKARAAGSVTMTMKRYDGNTKHIPKTGPVVSDKVEYSCLVRAVFRSRKITTVIGQREVTSFSTAYTTLLRSNLNGLKKLKKTKNKSKAT